MSAIARGLNMTSCLSQDKEAEARIANEADGMSEDESVSILVSSPQIFSLSGGKPFKTSLSSQIALSKHVESFNALQDNQVFKTIND